MKTINIPIWGLLFDEEVTYWASTRKNCLENRLHPKEKLIPLKIVKRTT